MNLKFKIILMTTALLIGIGILIPSKTWASEADPVTEDDKAFVLALKHAVEAHDVQWMTENVSLPIKVRIDRHDNTVKRRADFVKNYDKIINEQVTKAVAGQNVNDLFKNWRGIMIGRGEVWIGLSCNDDKCKSGIAHYIKSINNCFDGGTSTCTP